MNVADRTATAVLAVPESEEEADALSTLLTNFNRTDGLVAYYHNRPDEDDEHTPVALARRNDYEGAAGGCGGCDGCGPTEARPVASGFGDLVRRGLSYLAELALWFLAGAGLAAFWQLFAEDALRALARLVEP